MDKLGQDTHIEDGALEMIRAEVCRLGTGQSIRTTIMATDRAAITDYVLGRPRGVPSTRDYLNNDLRSAHCMAAPAQLPSLTHTHHLHYRDKFYADADKRLTSQRNMHVPNPTLSQGGTSRQKRVWSPDRATISAQLEGFRANIAAQRVAITRRSTNMAPDLAQIAK